MPPFGLPFPIPMLHDSKKILDRSSHKILSSPYDTLRDDREKDYLPPSWPPRGADLDNDRGSNDGDHERDWDRDKVNDRVLERLQMAYPSQLPDRDQQLLLQQTLQKKIHESQSSPLSLAKPSSTTSNGKTPLPRLEKLELVDKDGSESDKRTDEDKFSSSPEKDTSFSPPDGKLNDIFYG